MNSMAIRISPTMEMRWMLSIIVVLVHVTRVSMGHGVIMVKELVLDGNSVTSRGASLQVRPLDMNSLKLYECNVWDR